MNGNENEMVLTLGSEKIQFKKVELKFKDGYFQNVFADKNNKTLSETIEHHRYSNLSNIVLENYSEFLDCGLGEFLSILKKKNDENYRLFLNRYGDLEYSNFMIDDKSVLDKKGLYIYTVDDKVKYIGRCLDNFQKRINQGYGKIHPKNCYKDGQATNCHLNSKITENKYGVKLFVCFLDDNNEIIQIENDLIYRYSPDWDIVTRSKISFNSMINKFGGNEMIDINRPNTNKQKILNFLSANKDNGYCDECLENELDIHPRQQINQICRILKNEGKVDRIKSKCQNCKKEKILESIK